MARGGGGEWHNIRTVAALVVLVTVGLAGAADAQTLLDEPIQPLARIVGLDAGKVALGRRLFSDPLLSADGTISCRSCHDLAEGGSDHRPHSVGVGGAEGVIRAPTVYNSALNFVQFWDGRATDLIAQVDGPLTNPVEMGTTWEAVIAKLEAEPSYKAAFRTVYGQPVSPSAVRDALASFERSLITVDGRFDRFLRGDDKALSAQERLGYARFKSYGCASCHQGANVGGNMFQKFGFLGDYFADRGAITSADYGRYNVTHRESDRFVFKVPSLRLAALNGPYFHDGSAGDLATAVRVMGRYQLGRDIPDDDVRVILAFLASLADQATMDHAKADRP